MTGILEDLRGSIRTLMRHPGSSLAALLTLAIGIGGNTTIFSVVETLIINPLPFRDADRLVFLHQQDPEMGVTTTPSKELVRVCREGARSFEQIETYQTRTFALSGGLEPELASGALVSPSFFTFLGVKPALGRATFPDLEQMGEHRLVVLGHGLWASRFGSSPKILGERLQIDGEPYQIIGVLPSDFRIDAYSDIRFWVPDTTASPTLETDPGPLHTIARLAPGVTVEMARAEMQSLSAQVNFDDGTSLNWTGMVETPVERLDPRLRTALLVLQAAVGCVLLIACVNIANLLLAQGEGRSRELAMRAAVGAGRGRLMRQLLTESLVLSMVGGALGVLLATWGVHVVPLLLADAPEHLELKLGHLGYALALVVLSAVVFGILPAVQGSRTDVNRTLHQGSATAGTSRRRVRMRQALIVIEVAVTLVVLIAAGLLTRSFLHLQSLDLGFEPRNLLAFTIELPEERYAKGGAQTTFYEELLGSVPVDGRRIEAITAASDSVSEISAVIGRPELEGNAVDADQAAQLLILVTTMPDYFTTMGIELRAGRDFNDQDSDGGEPVIVINHTLAQRLSPEKDPVGRRIRFTDTWFRVVGIVGDVSLPALSASGQGALQVYFPARQSPSPEMTILVRAPERATAAVIDLVKARVWAIDPTVPVTRVATVRDLLADTVVQQRANALLMAVFAALAAILSVVGIYGVVTYSMVQRTREIGVRMALGATRWTVVQHVLGGGMRPVFIGMAVGLGATLILGRVLAGLLHGVGTHDPATITTVCGLVAVAALMATWLPALRAARLDPVAAIRQE